LLYWKGIGNLQGIIPVSIWSRLTFGIYIRCLSRLAKMWQSLGILRLEEMAIASVCIAVINLD
jgi:hypothetical protein